MRSLLVLLATSLSCAAQTLYSVTLVWEYPVAPPDSLTNYTFVLHGSADASRPLPWPVTAIVPGQTNYTLPIFLASGGAQFWYVTAGRASTDTELWLVDESGASNTASAHRVLDVRTTIHGGDVLHRVSAQRKIPPGKTNRRLASPKANQ